MIKRELAIQIHKDAVSFASDLGLKFSLVYGGVDYDKQRSLLQAGADVIIATPGRLIDYVKRSEEHTSELQSLMRISYAVFCLKKKTKNIQLRSERKAMTLIE